MKVISVVTACTISSLCWVTRMSANDLPSEDILSFPRHDALLRTIELEVTPAGVAIDFGVPVSSTELSHKKNIVFHGMDGVLCMSKADCEGTKPPTIIFVRKGPPIEFKDEEAMPDSSSWFFVDTNFGLFRFKLKPVKKIPSYTKVEIEPDPVSEMIPENSLLGTDQ